MEMTACGTSWKDVCWNHITAIIDVEGPGTAQQIEYEELATSCGEQPNDAVWREFAGAFFVALPSVPTHEMLLDLGLFKFWGDEPHESRVDFEQAYQRLLAKLPVGPEGMPLAPLEPDESHLLAIAGVDKFDFPSGDNEDGYCTEFDVAYEGYKLMLENYKLQGQPT